MYGIAAADNDVAWSVGYQGYILKTSNGGLGWGPQTSNTGASLNDVVALNASTAWAVGDSGTIVKTTDGGANWIVQTTNTSETFRRIAAYDTNNAWAVGTNGVILHTTNGGTTYVFHLRHGVMFQPPVSRELTAADVKYSFERMMKLPLAPATYFYVGVKGAPAFQAGKAKDISGVKVIDKYTVEFDLSEPDPAFLNAYTMWFGYVVAKEWVQKWGNRAVARHPLGTGPFIFDHWTPGREVVLKKNPSYWDKGKPYLDELKFVFSLSPSTALLKLEQEGYIASEWGASENNRKAKYYRLTKAGRKQLEKETQDWEQMTAILARFFSAGKESV